MVSEREAGLETGPDFDQSTNPVVSIQVARLRRAMERCYLTAGRKDPIRIDIPKGSYIPTISEDLPINRPIAIATDQTTPVSGSQAWPIVLVRLLANLTANPADNHLSIGIIAELTHALSHYREIRVLEKQTRGCLQGSEKCL